MSSTSDPSSTCHDDVVAALYRDHWGRLLALLIARTRRIDLAEDALSEAFERAVARWPRDGAPANPAGWLYTTASRHVIGRLRAEAIAIRRTPLLSASTRSLTLDDTDLDSLPDERLQLILLCCHPALPRESRSALALRLVLGTPTEQIARMFLVAPTTMAARLTRAKKKIVTAGIPLAVPADAELRMRLDEVCRTVYLAFTAGYAPGSGHDLMRADLAGEALRLARVLYELVPDAEEVRAMLALLMLQHSRRDARVRDGELVTLAEQNRSLWYRAEIDAGLALANSLPAARGYAEELRLQAIIAAEHARAKNAADTNWAAIAARYGELEALTASPVVRLNRAVAVAETEGPQAGLALLRGLDALLPANHRLHAVRADLARRAGDRQLATIEYRRALERCDNEVERSFLTARLAEMAG